MASPVRLSTGSWWAPRRGFDARVLSSGPAMCHVSLTLRVAAPKAAPGA
jgi:hypothetical protein